MPDEPVDEFEIRIEPDETDTEAEDHRKRRRTLSAVILLALLVVIVLILLLLPRCTSDERAARRESEKVIDAIPGRPAQPGMVAVWISGDTSIARVLSSAGLAGAETTDLGEGRFVIRVEEGSETDSVRKLRSIEGVHDAGFVFEDESAEP